MNRDCLIYIISSTGENDETAFKNTNEIGEPVFIEKKRQVFGIKKSVKQSEFFQAAARGFTPEIVVEINSFEYKNETICELEGQRFRIYRAYPIANSERVELYLTQLAGETDVFT